MIKFRNLMALVLLSVAIGFSSCAEDTTMDEIDGSQLTQPYEGSNGGSEKPPGGG